MTERLTASIRLSTETREKLLDLKTGNQTYDDVILDLFYDSKALNKARILGEIYTGDTKGMIMFRHMIKKLIDDWLPTHEKNQDYIRRFYYLIGEQAPTWLGELVTDRWWDRWLNDALEDARALVKEAEEEP